MCARTLIEVLGHFIASKFMFSGFLSPLLGSRPYAYSYAYSYSYAYAYAYAYALSLAAPWADPDPALEVPHVPPCVHRLYESPLLRQG